VPATAAAIKIPAAAAFAEQALRCDQHGHNGQGDQGQGNGPLGIPSQLPAIQDARRQAGNPEQPHGAQFVHHLHGTQGDARADRGQGNRQGNAKKARPWADPEAATGLQQSSTAD
jgi:hypothetical protein